MEKTPNNGDIYYYYGGNYLKMYFTDAEGTVLSDVSEPAMLLFKKGIDVDPNNPLNYIGLGKLALYSGDTANAKSYFSKAKSFLPSKANKNVVMDLDRQVLILYNIAEAYIKAPKKDFPEAYKLLGQAQTLLQDPKKPGVDKVKVPELYIIIGDYYMENNDGSNAISNYKKAQELDPSSPKAKLRIGQLWLRAKNYTDALEYYKDAIKTDSTFAPAYRELGNIYTLARQYDNAIKNYDKFLELSAGNISAKIRYASALINAKKYKEVIATIQEILSVDSSRIDLYRGLAYSYFETKQYDDGLKYIEKFIQKTKPEKVRADDYVYYGRLLSKTKNDSLAVEKLYKAYQMDTTRTELLSEIALSYSKLKKYDEGAKYYELLKTLGKATPGDYYNLGKVYYNLQNWNFADTNFASLISLQPDYVQAYLWHARTKSKIDQDATRGLAKPVYEIFIQKAIADSAKYSKDIFEAYSYLSYYYFVQYNDSKSTVDALNSIQYCEKALAIVPTDEKAKTILEAMKKVVK
ncbi:MAG: tetratricopeptide repeat protein [Lentimicrobiaceae bacterium]|nr:tetratricopeptide repeat protein [Lentimicrobiaceae bacterium]